jgi:fatty acid desaturase
MFEHHELRGWLKLAALMAAVAGCLTTIALTGWLGAVLLVPITGVLSTSIAMFGHEGSHKSFSKSPARNAVLLYLTFPLFGGLSGLYWREKHDRLHHGHPNVEGVDPDIKPFPFSSSRTGHEQCGPKERWFQRNFQKWLFWPMSTLMALGMRRSSLLYLMRYPNKRDREWWIEVTCILAHYTAWMVIPSLIWGPLAGIGVYSAVWAVVGVCLALVFAPAHMGMPVVADQPHDWIHQLETTRNLELPAIVAPFFIGLDRQVEHHLFPKIPHANLHRAAEITADWCRRHRIEHHSMPYLGALGSAVTFMATAWDRDADVPDMIRLAS